MFSATAMPEEEPLVKLFFRCESRTGDGGRVYYLVQGEDVELDGVMQRFQQEMSEREDVRYVVLPPSLEDLKLLGPLAHRSRPFR